MPGRFSLRNMPDLMFFEFVYAAEAFEWWLVSLTIRLGGYQPHYFPRLHCLARMLDSDISPIADYVQYVRKHAFPGVNGTRMNGPSYQAQTPVKTSNGVLLLGVPVAHSGERQRINEAKISYETDWVGKHLNVIRDAYRRAPRFAAVYPEIESVLSMRYDSLAQLDIATTSWAFAHLFELPARGARLDHIRDALPQEDARLAVILPISSTPVLPPDKTIGRDANDWIIDMCRHFGADEYYFGGTSATCYMDFKRFEDAGIRLKQQEWQCARYPQQHEGFSPNLSIIDLLMHLEPREARKLLHTSA
jgi:hypothetical protein